MDFKKSGRPLKRSCGFPCLTGAVSGGVHVSLLPGLLSSSVDLEALLKERGDFIPGKWNRFLNPANSRRESWLPMDWKIKRG